MHSSLEDQTVDDWLADYSGENVKPFRIPPAPNVEPPPTSNDNNEGVVDEKALIPDGEYNAWYQGYELQANFKGYGDKLIVSFNLADCEYAGEQISSFYNIAITKNGWKAKGGSRWVKEMRGLFPERKRKDRLPPFLLKNKKVHIDVRTVTKGKKQRALDPEEMYSVVRSMLRVVN